MQSKLITLFTFTVLAGFGNSSSIAHWNAKPLGELGESETFASIQQPISTEGYKAAFLENNASEFDIRLSGRAIAGSWQTFGALNGCNDDVEAIAISDSGLIYFGGRFTRCGRTSARNIVAYNPDTDTFQALGDDDQNGVNGSVHAIATSGDSVYVGGWFNEAGGTDAMYIARWDGADWHPIESAQGNGLSAPVKALLIDGENLYVGGYFREEYDGPGNHIARWDGNSWHPLGTGVDSLVNAFAISEDCLFVGGEFIEAGGIPVNRIACWNGTEWLGLGSKNNPGVNDSVNSLDALGNMLCLGGGFTEAGGISAKSVACWDGMDWHAIQDSEGSGLRSPVQALTLMGNDLIVGGPSELSGDPINYLLRWDGNTWRRMSTSSRRGVLGSVRALLAVGDTLYVGGALFSADEVPANGVAVWRSSSWDLLGSGGQNGINSRVNTIATTTNDIYAGGWFTTAGSEFAYRIARWDGSSWNSLGVIGKTGVLNDVNAITFLGESLYVAGGSGVSQNYRFDGIARWDGYTWWPLEGRPTTDNDRPLNGLNRAVTSLATLGDDLYVGGLFGAAGAKPARYIARWNGSDWHALESDGVNGVDRPVRALAASGGDLYVGGGFTEAGSISANHIARWDGSMWHPFESGGQNGVNGPVESIAIAGEDVYVGGIFSEAGGIPAQNIARWDGENWYALENGGNNGISGPVYAIAVAGDNVYVGGNFTEAGGMPARFIARWDGESWASLDIGDRNGVSSQVLTISKQGNHVYVGGGFFSAGGNHSHRIATFVETPDFKIDPGHTALWHSSERSGEGWVLEVLDPETALFYWFTFDEHGNQRWMMDVGSIDGNRIVFEEMLYTHGGRLGHTDPDAVERPLAGQAVMTFTDCSSGAIEFEAFDQNHVINFERLTWSSGLPCGDDGGSSDDPRAALTGTWYDPAHSGEGFVLQWMANGEALVIWFTYDNDGNQQWIIGTGQPDGEEVVFSDLHVARGARFGGDFDPGDVEREEWGELRLTLGCESGVARWESLHPEFASGQLSIQPLTKPDGLNCN